MNQLEKAAADLRHAYHQLTEGVVKDQAKFADGLIAPAICHIEQALGQGEPVSRVVLRDGAPTLLLDRDIKATDQRLYTAPQPQPKQEPVAWMYWQSCLNDDGTRTPWVQRFSKVKPQDSIINRDVTPLVAAPQQQREWVGLTDEELRDSLRECPHDTVENLRVRWLYAKDFARAIEAKLRKKNGGGV